jgi:hypothetical protein
MAQRVGFGARPNPEHQNPELEPNREHEPGTENAEA